MMMNSAFLNHIQTSIHDQKTIALLTITNHTITSLIGQKMIVWENGEVYFENQKLEPYISNAILHILPLIKKKKTKTICMNDLECFVEIFSPSPRLIIAGAGHICEPVYRIGIMLNFSVTIVDDRKEYATIERFPLASEVVCQSYMEYFKSCMLTEDTYILLVTRGHKHDVLSLQELLQRNEKVPYIGMIGSRRRISGVFEQLKEDFPDDVFDHIFTPVGLDIGAETPSEIAISIFSELLMVRNNKSGNSLSKHIRSFAKLGFRGG
ncbi:XdhC family protein [Bacillus timonensis]|nr:XdhC family protein [Bacillus timonensis]